MPIHCVVIFENPMSVRREICKNVSVELEVRISVYSHMGNSRPLVVPDQFDLINLNTKHMIKLCGNGCLF